VATSHFFVDTMLARGNHVREQWQRLAFQALLTPECGPLA
jgi:hypothetical protein